MNDNLDEALCQQEGPLTEEAYGCWQWSALRPARSKQLSHFNSPGVASQTVRQPADREPIACRLSPNSPVIGICKRGRAACYCKLTGVPYYQPIGNNLFSKTREAHRSASPQLAYLTSCPHSKCYMIYNTNQLPNYQQSKQD